MIYRDRKYLSILSLTEDRDYVTYEELIHVLTERPSSRVYIERDGILCGMITSSRVRRNRDKKSLVLFRKKFIFIHPMEYLRAQQIFREKEKINALPVVSEDGRLLGDYVRSNELIGTDYTELLYKDPYILQGLKEKSQNTVFVKPAVCKGTITDKMFLCWKQKLKSEKLHLRTIQHGEIPNYLHTAEYFLFVDEDEKCGAEIIYKYLHHDKGIENKSFYTITDYFFFIKRFADASFLEELQNQGIFILILDLKENSNQFLAALEGKIKKRNEEEYADHSYRLPEALKESFFGELYCEAYKMQKFPLPSSFYLKSGIPYFSDAETEFLNIRNGERLTVGQPEKYDRCVYLYGPCLISGAYSSDQYTIPSLLQNEINQAGFFCKVFNRSIFGNATVDRVQLASFKRGDIIILDQYMLPEVNLPSLNLTDVLEKHDAPTYWFVDNVRHCNHKANQVFAHAIYEELLPVLQQPSGERTPVELDHDYIDRFYLRHYFSAFDSAGHGTVGSIVMNCNPFTFGHRFLIEEALKTVDFLIIFVVEEDASLFFFQERFAMVCQGTSDLERVMVVPSGPYILSKNTFPEYFQKIDDEDLKKNTEDDITLFAEKIAPRLGITYRFVGEEREDKVTNEYNEAMKRILPRYGIQVIEIPRKANGQSAISASRVRQCLSMNQTEELDELVPDSTKRILFYENT